MFYTSRSAVESNCVKRNNDNDSQITSYAFKPSHPALAWLTISSRKGRIGHSLNTLNIMTTTTLLGGRQSPFIFPVVSSVHSHPYEKCCFTNVRTKHILILQSKVLYKERRFRSIKNLLLKVKNNMYKMTINRTVFLELKTYWNKSLNFRSSDVFYVVSKFCLAFCKGFHNWIMWDKVLLTKTNFGKRADLTPPELVLCVPSVVSSKCISK